MYYSLKGTAVCVAYYNNEKTQILEGNTTENTKKSLKETVTTIIERPLNIIFKIEKTGSESLTRYEIPIESILVTIFLALPKTTFSKDDDTLLKNLPPVLLKDLTYESIYFLNPEKKENILKHYNYFIKHLYDLKPLTEESPIKEINDLFDNIENNNLLEKNERTLKLLLSSCDPKLMSTYFDIFLEYALFDNDIWCLYQAELSENIGVENNKYNMALLKQQNDDDFYFIASEHDRTLYALKNRLYFKYVSLQVISFLKKHAQIDSSFRDLSLYENIYTWTTLRKNLTMDFYLDMDDEYYSGIDGYIYSSLSSFTRAYLNSIVPVSISKSKKSENKEKDTEEKNTLDKYIRSLNLKNLEENIFK